MTNLTFLKAKKKREELQLPILHFVVTDDWIEKLGNDAFCAWLKFYSWCDRSEDRKDHENDVIPTSFNRIMTRLGVGKKKFYNAIIRPLWNFGLIDIVEYTDSVNKGNKPMNIVVYEYPQNDVSKKYEPLKKIRDYDEDYSSDARTFAKKGGRKDKNECFGGFLEKPGWFRGETRGGFVGKHNNVLNSITNDSNSNNNKTLDTGDTVAGSLQSEKNKNDYLKTEKIERKEKDEKKKEFMKKGFFENSEKVPKRISELLRVFSESEKQAQEYYKIILRAKSSVEKERGIFILIEEHQELEHEIINAFSRAVRKIEREQNVENSNGYLYKTIYETIKKYTQTQYRSNEYHDLFREFMEN